MQGATNDASPFIPSYAAWRDQAASRDLGRGELRAHRAALRDHPPLREAKLAAVIVVATTLTRSQWTDDVELSESLYAEHVKQPASLERHLVSRSYRIIDPAAPVRHQRCSYCQLRPGHSPCTACSGTGTVFLAVGQANYPDACSQCQGQGLTVCTICGGAAQSYAVSMTYIDDTVFESRQAFTVPIGNPFYDQVQELVAQGPMPAALSRPLEPNATQSAYRGESAGAAYEFHGHAFGDAARAALASIRESSGRPGIVRHDTVTFVWPLLSVAYEYKRREYEAVLVADASGAIRELLNP